jgi:hypothetical protein
MSEMLTNHYFHARDYAHAMEGYEVALATHPGDKAMRRRLIICYIETGAIRKAFAIFIDLVIDDADFIINTHPVDDDCPCPELVKRSENVANEPISMDDFLRLGMLWLYCNLEKSCQHFGQALALDPHNREIELVLSQLAPKREILINLPSTQRPMESFQ